MTLEYKSSQHNLCYNYRNSVNANKKYINSKKGTHKEQRSNHPKSKVTIRHTTKYIPFYSPILPNNISRNTITSINTGKQ